MKEDVACELVDYGSDIDEAFAKCCRSQTFRSVLVKGNPKFLLKNKIKCLQNVTDRNRLL